MQSINLDLIKTAFIASVQTPNDDDKLLSNDIDDSDDDDAFTDALSELPEESQSSLTKKADFVDALEYTKAYAEIARLFQHLNVAFAFIGKNLESSCEIINDVVSKHNQEGSVSLEQTLEFEDVQENKDALLSSVLWLHRPLEFILALFRDLVDAPDTEIVSDMAKRCYLDTLGRHHAWPIQQMVCVLLLTLPDRAQVIETMNYETAEALEKVSEITICGQVVYDRVERMVKRLNLKI